MKIQKTSKNLNQTIKLSIELAKEYRKNVVDENILFLALLSLKNSAAVRTLIDLNIDVENTIENLKNKISASVQSVNTISIETSVYDIDISSSYKKILESSYKVAMTMAAPYVGTEHLLIAWYENTDSEIKNSLLKKGIDSQNLYASLRNTVKYPVLVDDKNIMDKNSMLKMLGKNLTEMARSNQLDMVVGREKEMNRVISILTRRTKNNPILLGDAGVGKTAIIEGLAQKIVNGNVPFAFKDKSIWQIDSTLLFSGSQMRGDVEGKILALIEEVSADPNIILFVDEIHTLIGNSQAASGGTDVANILKPALAKGMLRCIGATTYAEYVKFFESDPALSRRFQPVYVEEIDSANAKVILKKIKPTLEKYHNVKITDEIIDESVNLSVRYITDRFLPDKALDLLDEASAKLNLKKTSFLDNDIKILSELESEEEKMINQNDINTAAKIRLAKRNIEKIIGDATTSSKNFSVLKVADIKEVVSEWTGIPVNSLSTEETKNIKNLASILSSHVIGQNNAVKIVANAIQVARSGISDEKKPMASFLFAGPTGVGKTELAKQIAATLFGSRDNIIQMDMSEFMESHSVSKLIGSPPGYIGFDLGGQLTEKIRKRPYNVVLFDEIEKAHPDVLNILLQILEEGRLTDSKGKIANFRNTIIIMTTNLGAQAISGNDVLGLKVLKDDEKSKEAAYEDMQRTVLQELKKVLQPEFINRIDSVVVFRSLLMTDIDKITKIHLDELMQRIKDTKKIDATYTNSVIKNISKAGFDAEYGARNIKRKIKELVESEIGKYLINAKKKTRNLTVDYKNESYTVK